MAGSSSSTSSEEITNPVKSSNEASKAGGVLIIFSILPLSASMMIAGMIFLQGMTFLSPIAATAISISLAFIAVALYTDGLCHGLLTQHLEGTRKKTGDLIEKLNQRRRTAKKTAVRMRSQRNTARTERDSLADQNENLEGQAEDLLGQVEELRTDNGLLKTQVRVSAARARALTNAARGHEAALGRVAENQDQAERIAEERFEATLRVIARLSRRVERGAKAEEEAMQGIAEQLDNILEDNEGQAAALDDMTVVIPDLTRALSGVHAGQDTLQQTLEAEIQEARGRREEATATGAERQSAARHSQTVGAAGLFATRSADQADDSHQTGVRLREIARP